jgi:hypothetical protein
MEPLLHIIVAAADFNKPIRRSANGLKFGILYRAGNPFLEAVSFRNCLTPRPSFRATSEASRRRCEHLTAICNVAVILDCPMMYPKLAGDFLAGKARAARWQSAATGEHLSCLGASNDPRYPHSSIFCGWFCSSFPFGQARAARRSSRTPRGHNGQNRQPHPTLNWAQRVRRD